MVEDRSDFELTKDTPYLALTASYGVSVVGIFWEKLALLLWDYTVAPLFSEWILVGAGFEPSTFGMFQTRGEEERHVTIDQTGPSRSGRHMGRTFQDGAAIAAGNPGG